VVEVPLKLNDAKSLADIDLTTACRQLVRHPITLGNPLAKPVTFKCESKFLDGTNNVIQFEPESFSVPAGGESTLDLLFRPVQVVDEGQAEVTLTNDELGVYPYTVKYSVGQPGLEKTLALKAPLGGSAVETFKFLHYLPKPTTYTAQIVPAPGHHQGSVNDFIVETKEIGKGAIGTATGVEIAVEIRFQPSVLAECRALLVLSSPDCYDYKALLVGYTQPPQPQGPVEIAAGKPGTVVFMNPFDQPAEFTFQLDNPSFSGPPRMQKLDPKKPTNIPVTFKPEPPKAQGGRLIVTNPQVSTPWIFFLKGTL